LISWTFFLAKNVPTAAQVESSAGGLLGIQNVPSVAMAAYSATFNEFWVANWYAFSCCSTLQGFSGSKKGNN
jgi:hypothetical protein